MPILSYIPCNPIDLVIQGEQMRVSVMDAPVAMVGNVCGGSVVTGFSSLVQDEDAFLPMNSFVEGNLLSMRRARNNDTQRRVNGGIATPCGAWVPMDYSPLLNPLLWATEQWAISGVTKDGTTNTPLAGCFVIASDAGRLTQARAEVEETISDGSGNYSMIVPLNTAYQLTAFLAGAPDRVGITLPTVTPTAVG